MSTAPENQLKAVIFDMDGVIIDTCDLHRRAWQEVGALYGYDWPKHINFKKDVFGTVSRDSAALLFGEQASNNHKLIERKDKAYEKLLAQNIGGIIVPGVVEFITFLKKVSGLKLAVATSARKEEARFVIEAAGIAHLFDVVVDISQVTHAKPHPEIYLNTLAKLGLSAAECVAFEDSISGYLSVAAAGLRCILVKTTMSDEKIARHQITPEASIDSFLPAEVNKLSLVPDFVPNFIS